MLPPGVRGALVLPLWGVQGYNTSFSSFVLCCNSSSGGRHPTLPSSTCWGDAVMRLSFEGCSVTSEWKDAELT